MPVTQTGIIRSAVIPHPDDLGMPITRAIKPGSPGQGAVTPAPAPDLAAAKPPNMLKTGTAEDPDGGNGQQYHVNPAARMPAAQDTTSPSQNRQIAPPAAPPVPTNGPDGPAGTPMSGAPAGIVASAMTPTPSTSTATGGSTPSGQTQAPGSTTGTASNLPVSSDPNAASTTPDPYSIKATTHDVGAQETVQGQLKTLLDSGSPILASARERAMRMASSRGLVNSAMAAQSGEQAVIDSATPIATADAGTFSRQALANQDAQNQFSSADKSLSGQEKLAGAERTWQTGEKELDRSSTERIASQDTAARLQASNTAASASMESAKLDASTRLSVASQQLEASRADIASRERTAAADFDNRLSVANIDANTRTSLANIDANVRRDTNLSTLQQNTLTNYGAQVSQILSNQNLSTEDKQNAIRNINGVYGGSPYLPVTINWNYNTPPPGG